MSSLRLQDRVSLCRFTFADGRHCRTPRDVKHPRFCFDHARKESRALSVDKLARELSYFLSGEYLSANDLSAALGRLVPAVLQSDIKPRTARTVAYLAQTLVQTVHLAQHEYINAFGTDDWRDAIRDGVNQNFAHRNPPPPANPQPTIVADLQIGASVPQSPLPAGTSAPQPTHVEAGLQPGSSAPQPASTTAQPNPEPIHL